jgi:glucose/arabinose dehydrogenase
VVRRAAFIAFLLLVVLAPPAGAFQEFEPVATDLAFPTNLAFSADGRVFFTEKDSGNVRILQEDRVLPEPFSTLPVDGGGEKGLLGIALDPGFPEEPWVYVYYSDAADGRNRLVRIRAEGDVGTERRTLLELLPTVNGYHNGGDLAFGPDGKLYVVTGEAHEAARAQDPNDLGGKILRLNPDGSFPADNPFGPTSPVFALGIRNSFGLCFDPGSGALWETENGPSSDDEVNQIRAGQNYGWPDQLGPGGAPGFVDPVLDFPEVIVPTGCAFAHGAVWFGDYHGELHRATLDSDGARQESVRTFDAGIADVARGPDGSLWVATVDAIYREAGAVSASPSPTGSRSSPAPTAGPEEPLSGLRSGAGIVVLLLILGALFLVRSRLMRRSRG